MLYDRCGAHKLHGPNDIVFDAHGGFYFTDLGKARARDRDYGGVYYALADGSKIVEVAHPVLTPNGIGLSPDGKRLYVAETETGAALGVRHRRAGRGEQAGVPVAAWRAAGRRAWPGSSGSTAWRWTRRATSAWRRWSTAAISVIAPDGRLVRQVAMPDPLTTNICFGGPDLRTAYMTLSGTGQAGGDGLAGAGAAAGVRSLSAHPDHGPAS